MHRWKRSARLAAAVLCAALAACPLAGCGASDAKAEQAAVTTTPASSSATTTSASFSANGTSTTGSSASNRVRYGRMPDSDELLVIRTASNQTTAYGKVPVTGTSSPQELSVFLSGFETSRQVFIWVDGTVVGMYDPAEKRVEVTLSEAQLQRGTHSVEATQHAGDIPTAAVTLYKCCQYSVEG